ncbi:MAG: glycosyltransferase [Desulfovibrio sp.]|jgi:glycosyltransferase involved in cell wall biosynthesis|nr:glycosyltransferase [Desulfovibrio sp.]
MKNKTVIVHLGTAGCNVLARKAWSDNPDLVSGFGGKPVFFDLNDFFPLDAAKVPVALPAEAGVYFVDGDFFSGGAAMRREDWQARFPGCRLLAFFSLVRQDMALDAFFAWRCLCGMPCSPQGLAAKLPVIRMVDYAENLRGAFRLFGRENTWLHVDLSGKDPDGALDAFWRFAGLPAPGAGGLYPRPRMSLSLSRDFLRFIQICIPLAVTLQKAWDSPWIAHSQYFEEQNPRSFFSPEERRDFLAKFAASNAEAAAILGLERLFSDPAPEPDWEPFPGLTPEAAYGVAERLDRDFARARMAEFDAASVCYMTREQHLVRRALHDVCDGPSAFSPAPARHAAGPKLSVLTLAYNHARYITENIESVLAQRVNFPLQHIIADDGSNDGTRDIILKYAAKHPHIVPVFQKNRTYGAENLRVLFDMCRTEYAALCDGDDYFTDPLKLQSQADFLDEHKDCGMCFHPVRVIFQDGTGREPVVFPDPQTMPRGVRPFYYLIELVRWNFMQSNAVMYRWRFKDGLPGWFRTDLCPGDWYWHLLHAEQGKIGFINKTMSVYRRHSGGVYHLSDTDRPKHRARVGMKQLESYDVINKHFNRKYESILLELTDSVFAECFIYDTERAEEEGGAPVMEKMCDAYPEFAQHFIDTVTKGGGQKPG